MGISNHTRYAKTMPHIKQINRRIPVLDVARDKPSLQAVVASPGWREMSLSARVIAITLFAFARMDEKNSVTISRKGLSDLTGITDPCTLAKANREVQAIGLFEITRGYKTTYSSRPTVYRLTWWSRVFQRWLKAGYAVADNGSGRDLPQPEAHDNLINIPDGSAGEPAAG
jgi:hypothetical protein